jgi:hypothetical protein
MLFPWLFEADMKEIKFVDEETFLISLCYEYLHIIDCLHTNREGQQVFANCQNSSSKPFHKLATTEASLSKQRTL